MKTIIKWFAVLMLIADTAFIICSRFSHPDMTSVRWFITYWREWLVYFIVLWLGFWLYAISQAKGKNP